MKVGIAKARKKFSGGRGLEGRHEVGLSALHL